MNNNEIEQIIKNIITENPNILKGRVSNAGIGQNINVQTEIGTIVARNTNIISPQGDVNLVIGDNGENLVWGIENSTIHEDRTVRKGRGGLQYYPFKRFYTPYDYSLYKDGDGRKLVSLQYYGETQSFALGGTNLGKDKFLALFYIQGYIYFVDKNNIYYLGFPNNTYYLGNEYCKHSVSLNGFNSVMKKVFGDEYFLEITFPNNTRNYNYGINFEYYGGDGLSIYNYDGIMRRKYKSITDVSGYISDLRSLPYNLNFNLNYLDKYIIPDYTIIISSVDYDRGTNVGSIYDTAFFIEKYTINSNLNKVYSYPISHSLVGRNYTTSNGIIEISEIGSRTENYNLESEVVAEARDIDPREWVRNIELYFIDYSITESYSNSESVTQTYNLTIDYNFPDKIIPINNTETITTNIDVTISLIDHKKYEKNDPIEQWYFNNKFPYLIISTGTRYGYVETFYNVSKNIQISYNFDYTFYECLFVFDVANYLFIKFELKGNILTNCNVNYENSFLNGILIGIVDWLPGRVQASPSGLSGSNPDMLFTNPVGTQSFVNNLTKGKILKTNIGEGYDFYNINNDERILELSEIKIGETEIYADNDFFFITRQPFYIDIYNPNHLFDKFEQLYIGKQSSYYRFYTGLNEDWFLNLPSFEGYFFTNNKLCLANFTFNIRTEPENEAFYVEEVSVNIIEILDTYCVLEGSGIFNPIDTGSYIEYYAGIFSKNSLFCLMRLLAENPLYQFKQNMNTAMIKNKPMWYFTDINADYGKTRVDVYTVENNRIIRKPNITDKLIKAKKSPMLESISYHPNK